MLSAPLPATVAQPQWEPAPVAAISAPAPVAPAAPPMFTIREPDGDYYGPDQNCESGSTPLPAGLWVDPCYHGGVALLSHDWSYGATFYRLRMGEQVMFRGRVYRVSGIEVLTVEQTYWLFTRHTPLLLITCDGPRRLVVSASLDG